MSPAAPTDELSKAEREAKVESLLDDAVEALTELREAFKSWAADATAEEINRDA